MQIPAIALEPVNWIKVPLMAALGLIGLSLILAKMRDSNVADSGDL